MTGVTKWTGREAELLRTAMRKKQKEFAELVGVSPRQIPRWKRRGETIELEIDNQAALDTLLAQAKPEVQQRFAALLTERAAVEHDERAEELLRKDPSTLRHPVDGKVMTLVPEGIYLSGPDNRAVWLESFLIDVYPTTNEDYARFVQATNHRPSQHWPDGHCPVALATHPVVWVTCATRPRTPAGQAKHCLPYASGRRRLADRADASTDPGAALADDRGARRVPVRGHRQRGDGPDCAARSNAAADGAWDDLLLMQAAQCCTVIRNRRPVFIRVDPVGPTGGCVGSVVALWLDYAPSKVNAGPASPQVKA